MSDATTRRMIELYQQDGAAPVPFLSGMFQSPPQNFYNSKEVEFDILRSDEEVAIVIQSLSGGARNNDANLYTNKSFVPPIYKERAGINAADMIERSAGRNPFEDVNFQANATQRAFRQMRLMENKIRRAIELQASQVLQAGTSTLIDSAGTTVYSINFAPKSSHFPTAGTAWNAVGGDPIGDLSALAEIIRNDGLSDPDQLIFGIDAWTAFIDNAAVLARFDNRRIETGRIVPMDRMGNGGTYRGVVEIGNYSFECWTYGGRFVHPQTGTKTQYVTPAKVIMRASQGRLDATFGGIPMLVPPEQRVMPYLPSRIMGDRVDMHQTAFVSDDGENLFVQVGARPLMIPTAIDTYGCIATGV